MSTRLLGLLAVLLLACPLMLAAPMDNDGPHAWSSDFHSAPRAMDDVDLAILDALSADLDGHAHAANEHASDTPSSSAAAQMDNSRANVVDAAPARSRGLSSLHSLPIIPPLTRPHPHTIRFVDDAPLRDRINRNLFAGHLHWVDAKLLRLSEKSYASRSPYRHHSRRLPIVQPADAASRGWMRVHITEHRVSSGLRRTPLEGRTHWGFWGVPEEGAVVHLGHGYVEREEEEKVDRFLGRLLEGVRGAASGAHG